MGKPEDSSNKAVPHGEIVMRTIAMPSDANANGDIFGGWLMGQMDIGGAVLARSVARGRVATVAADSMSFVSPVAVGDVVTCYARVVAIGRTSMKIEIDVWVQSFKTTELRRVTEGVFTYVAIDEDGRPRPVPRDGQE